MKRQNNWKILLLWGGVVLLSGCGAAPKITDPFIIGSATAPHKIVEYTNYLCVHCEAFHKENYSAVYNRLIKSGTASFELRLLTPKPLLRAVLCARDLGAGEKLHEVLFRHHAELVKMSEADYPLETYVTEAGINLEQWQQCWSGDKYHQDDEAYAAAAEADGVTGTPTFFIDNIKAVGNIPLSAFESAIK